MRKSKTSRFPKRELIFLAMFRLTPSASIGKVQPHSMSISIRPSFSKKVSAPKNTTRYGNISNQSSA